MLIDDATIMANLEKLKRAGYQENPTTNPWENLYKLEQVTVAALQKRVGELLESNTALHTKNTELRAENEDLKATLQLWRGVP